MSGESSVKTAVSSAAQAVAGKAQDLGSDAKAAAGTASDAVKD